MNEKKATYVSIGFVLVALLLLWWYRRYQQNANSTPDAIESLGVDPRFTNPYFYNTPGVPDMPQILNGSNSPFQSVINVGVNVDAFSGLSNRYIPMFGFVGVSAIGQM